MKGGTINHGKNQAAQALMPREPEQKTPKTLENKPKLLRPSCLRCVKALAKNPGVVCKRPNQYQACSKCRKGNASVIV